MAQPLPAALMANRLTQREKRLRLPQRLLCVTDARSSQFTVPIPIPYSDFGLHGGPQSRRLPVLAVSRPDLVVGKALDRKMLVEQFSAHRLGRQGYGVRCCAAPTLRLDVVDSWLPLLFMGLPHRVLRP
jgi:hypothetical protein